MEELQAQAADKAIENATLLVDLEIASKQERCRVYGDIYQRMLQVVEERAADASMAKVPGGRTGLLVRQIKVLGMLQQMPPQDSEFLFRRVVLPLLLHRFAPLS
jgi:hypothetical protein